MANPKAADPAAANTASPACSDCRFWLARSHLGQGVMLVGSCRRLPPTPTLSGPSAQPITRANEWCGEHAPTS